MIRGIHHVSLKCADPEKFAEAENFYCGILGLQVRRRWKAGIMIDTGAGLIEIFNNEEGILEKGAVRHFALACTDTVSLAQKIGDAGYEVFEGPKNIVIEAEEPYPAVIAFCRGPLNEEIELFQEL